MKSILSFLMFTVLLASTTCNAGVTGRRLSEQQELEETIERYKKLQTFKNLSPENQAHVERMRKFILSNATIKFSSNGPRLAIEVVDKNTQCKIEYHYVTPTPGAFSKVDSVSISYAVLDSNGNPVAFETDAFIKASIVVDVAREVERTLTIYIGTHGKPAAPLWKEFYTEATNAKHPSATKNKTLTPDSKMQLREFAAIVNEMPGFKYYFTADLNNAEVGGLGFEISGFYLRPLSGKEQTEVVVDDLLNDAFEKLKAKNCKSILGK